MANNEADIKPDIEAAVDRNEAVSLMEPLLIGESSRHRAGLTDLALELAQNDNRLEVSYLQHEQKFTDDFLTPLKDLTGLVHLNLRGQDVTDAHLVHVKDLTSLTRLHLVAEVDGRQARLQADLPSRQALALEPGTAVRIRIDPAGVRVFPGPL